MYEVEDFLEAKIKEVVNISSTVDVSMFVSNYSVMYVRWHVPTRTLAKIFSDLWYLILGIRTYVQLLCAINFDRG